MTRERKTRATLRAFRFDAETEGQLAAIQHYEHDASMSDAVRMAIRHYYFSLPRKFRTGESK